MLFNKVNLYCTITFQSITNLNGIFLLETISMNISLCITFSAKNDKHGKFLHQLPSLLSSRSQLFLNGGHYPRSDTRQTRRTSQFTLVSQLPTSQLIFCNIRLMSLPKIPFSGFNLHITNQLLKLYLYPVQNIFAVDWITISRLQRPRIGLYEVSYFSTKR